MEGDGTGEGGRREARFAWGWAVVYAGVVLLGMWRHELWRDEYQAWLFARDSASVWELFANLRYEGHPPLWHLILHVVTRFTAQPAAMQAVHLALSTAASWLVLRRAPFGRLGRLAFCFGYYMLYEYGVISRNYSLGVLFAVLFCIRYRDSVRPGAGTGLILAGLALSNPFAMLLSLALGLFVAVDRFLMPGPREVRWNRGVFWMLGLGAAGVILALWLIVPPPDGGFIDFSVRPDGSRLDSLRLTLSHVWTSHLPIPQPGVGGWGTNGLSGAGGGMASGGGAAILALSVLILLRNVRALWLYLTGTGGYLAYFYLMPMVSQYPRYTGHLFLVLAMSLWFSRTLVPGWTLQWSPGWSRVRAAAERVGVGLLLAVQGWGGLMAYVRDWRHPFTNSAAAAAFIAESGLEDCALVGTQDYVIQPLAAKFNRSVYYPERGAFGSFIVWDQRRLGPVTPAVILEPCFGLRRETGRPVLVVLSAGLTRHVDGREVPIEDEPVGAGHVLRFLADFSEPSICGDEDYFVYVFDRSEGAGAQPTGTSRR